MLTLDNPEMRNAMSQEMTDSWVRAIDQLAADRSVRVVVVTGEGSAFCSGGNTSWIASEPDATRGPPAHPDDRVLPGLALDPAPRGADDRRGQRRRHRRRAVPGAGLRPAVRRARAPSWGCRSSSSACTPAWAAPTCCPRSWGRRTPRTCCSPAGSSTPTRRCGSGWSRGCMEPATFRDDVLEIAAGHRGRRPDRHPADHAGAARRRAQRPGDRPAVGGAGPAGHAGHRGPAGGHRGQRGRSGRRSSPASRRTGNRRGPRIRLERPAFPLRISLAGPGGLVLRRR